MSCVEFMSMMMYLILKFDLVFTYFLRKMGKHTNIFVTKYSVIFITRPQKSGCLTDIFHQKLNNLLFNSIYTLCALGFL